MWNRVGLICCLGSSVRSASQQNSLSGVGEGSSMNAAPVLRATATRHASPPSDAGGPSSPAASNNSFEPFGMPVPGFQGTPATRGRSLFAQFARASPLREPAEPAEPGRSSEETRSTPCATDRAASITPFMSPGKHLALLGAAPSHLIVHTDSVFLSFCPGSGRSATGRCPAAAVGSLPAEFARPVGPHGPGKSARTIPRQDRKSR